MSAAGRAWCEFNEVLARKEDAAEEMYDALKAVWPFMAHHNLGPGSYEAFMQMTRALAKAEGKS